MECKIAVLKKTDFSRSSGRDASKSVQVTSSMRNRHHVCQVGRQQKSTKAWGLLQSVVCLVTWLLLIPIHLTRGLHLLATTLSSLLHLLKTVPMPRTPYTFPFLENILFFQINLKDHLFQKKNIS